MKIRTGFVSNSSSSSFIVMGRWADTDTVIRGLMKTKHAHRADTGPDEKESLKDYVESFLDGSRELEDEFDIGDDLYMAQQDDRVILGIPLDQMTDEQTLLDFKTMAANAINLYLGSKLTADKMAWEEGEIE